MQAEVIIVGGGIIGCAAAYYLAKEGVSVLVLEGSPHIGNGGSTRNGGGVRQSGRDPRELPLVMYAIQNLWPKLSDMLDTNVEYYQHGNLRLGSTPAHEKILQGLTDRAAACGLDVRMISGDEARRINPYLSDVVTCASWCPTDGHANPLMATMGYYKMARRLGAHFISDEKVVELRKIKGAVRQVVTASGNVYEGDKVILAAGYESRFIASTVGIDIPMQPVLLETLVTEAVAPMFWQMLGTADADFYGHQTEHGSFVFRIRAICKAGQTGFLQYCSVCGLPRHSALLPVLAGNQSGTDMGRLDGCVCRPCSGNQYCGRSAGLDSCLRLYRTRVRDCSGGWLGIVPAGNRTENSR